LLGSCLTPRIRPGRLISIAAITIISFAVLFAPLLLGSLRSLHRKVELPTQPPPPFLAQRNITIDRSTTLGVILLQTSQAIHRCFPFARGLFEDKVANFWCALNTIYKLRKLSHLIPLERLSLFATLMSILPACLIIGSNPSKPLLPYALASSAWGFFLFSFQVHEKSVLLPLLPMTLLLGSAKGLSKEFRAWIGWANALGVWTMYPLLKRDGLAVPYAVLALLWAYLLGLPPTSALAYYTPGQENVIGRPLGEDELRTPTKILHWQYYVVMAFWHILEAFAIPPEDKPDLWVVVNACFGAVGFGICYLWCTWKLIVESGLLDDYFAYQQQSAAVAEEKEKGRGKEGKKTK
jgi:alpha-1,3-glucosyltransferase